MQFITDVTNNLIDITNNLKSKHVLLLVLMLGLGQMLGQMLVQMLVPLQASGLVLGLLLGLGLGLGLVQRQGLWLGLMLGLGLGLWLGLDLWLWLGLGLMLGLMLGLVQRLGLGLLQRLDLMRKRSSKGYIRWLAKVLPEDWRAELEALRHKWRKKRHPKFLIEFRTFLCLLGMLKAFIQIKVENTMFFGRKRRF